MEHTRLGYLSIYLHGKMVSIRFYLSSSPNACLYVDRCMLFVRCIFFCWSFTLSPTSEYVVRKKTRYRFCILLVTGSMCLQFDSMAMIVTDITENHTTFVSKCKIM